MYFCITLEFGANGITSEVNEYQEYNRDTLEEANAFFDSAIADAARMGITGIRLESFSETITELRTWGTYA